MNNWNTGNQWYTPRNKVTKVTETYEYDDKGNLVKKTVVTETTEPNDGQPIVTYNK